MGRGHLGIAKYLRPLAKALIKKRLWNEGMVAVVFVDDAGQATESYPFNPNGSPGGLTGICSPDGRHLAMMPHPEPVLPPLAVPVAAGRDEEPAGQPLAADVPECVSVVYGVTFSVWLLQPLANKTA